MEEKKNKIRVLVVDDSAFMRKKISEMINGQDDMEVVAVARSGEEALKSIVSLKPDVITLDIVMEGMDGLTCLGYIMSEWPTPVVMLSAYTKLGEESTIQALELGAVDFVCKPGGEISLNIDLVREELLEKIRVASKVNVRKLHVILTKKAPPRLIKKAPLTLNKVVAIGASTGGPRALAAMIPKLSEDFPASILIVQHMPEGFTKSFADRLSWESKIKVKEAEDGEILKPGVAYIGRGGHHFSVQKEDRGLDHTLCVKKGSSAHHTLCPTVDMMMKSVAEHFGSHSIGVILTGMGEDGREGLKAIYQAGGQTIAQDEASSIVYGMAKVCIEAGIVNQVLPQDSIAFALEMAVKYRQKLKKVG